MIRYLVKEVYDRGVHRGVWCGRRLADLRGTMYQVLSRGVGEAGNTGSEVGVSRVFGAEK